MKVSIIIPCYNCEAYLPACLDSVLSQTFADFELILVDDGSSDHTLIAAQAYAKKDLRIRVLHQENAGVSSARNLGLAHAKGEWVTFVDGDDLLPPHALETLLSAADESIDLVVAAHETFTPDGICESVFPQTRWMDKTGEGKRRAAALRLIEGDSVLNIMCNKLHRRALIEREGIRLTAGLRIAEDALFNLEAVLLGRGVAYVNRVCYRYRLHAASATGSRTDSEYERHLPWLKAMSAMLQRRGVMETYFPAFLDSVVLRLYKDGGVSGVMRGFAGKVKPLVCMEDLDVRRMSARARLLLSLCRSGAYAHVYPLIYPVQVIRRKLGEAAFMLRAQKEKPQ